MPKNNNTDKVDINTLQFLKSNDISGLVDECGNDTLKVINLLFDLTIDSLIDSGLIWKSNRSFNENIIFTEYATNFCSYKIKAYSWLIIIIYNLNLEEKTFILFKKAKNKYIYDYKPIWKTNTVDTLDIIERKNRQLKSRTDKHPIAYKLIKNDIYLDNLCSKLEKWINKINIYGIDSLHVKSLFPINKREFEIVQEW